MARSAIVMKVLLRTFAFKKKVFSSPFEQESNLKFRNLI